MDSEDEFEEISRFLDQESGSILTNVAQDLILESYGTCWTSEADFFHEFGSLHSYSETSLQYEVDNAIHEQLQNGPAQMEIAHDWSFLNIPINNESFRSDVEMLPQDISEVTDKPQTVEAPERELFQIQPHFVVQSEPDSMDSDVHPPKLLSQRFHCSDCGSSYSRNSDLTRHKKEKHSDSLDTSEFFCPYCLDRFGRKQNCVRHLKRCDLVPSGLSAREVKEPLTQFPGML